MTPWMRFATRALLVLAASLSALSAEEENGFEQQPQQPPSIPSSSSSSSSSSVLWKCDDLFLPNLCTADKNELTLTTGHVTLMDLDVHYFLFKCSNTAGGSKNNTTAGAATPGSTNDFPVVVISGGPGLPHDGDLPLKHLACGSSLSCGKDGATTTTAARRSVLFYDPAGTGQSKLPIGSNKNTNATVWDAEYQYLDLHYYAKSELPALLDALHWDQVHLVGQDYGTIVALEYALSDIGIQRVASLTLNGPIPSVPDYYDAAWDPLTGSIGTMPEVFRHRYADLVERQDFRSEEFEAMEEILFAQFIYRSGILTDCLRDNHRGMNMDLYHKLFGISEWVHATGTLKDFDVIPQLSKLVDIPMLLTVGEFDTVRPPTVEKMRQILPKAELVRVPGAAHVTWVDAADDLLRSISDFWQRVESQGTQFEPKVGTSPPPKPTPATPAAESSDSGGSDATDPATKPPPGMRPPPPNPHRTSRWSLVCFFVFLVGLFLYVNRRDVWGNERHRYDVVV